MTVVTWSGAAGKATPAEGEQIGGWAVEAGGGGDEGSSGRLGQGPRNGAPKQAFPSPLLRSSLPTPTPALSRVHFGNWLALLAASSSRQSLTERSGSRSEAALGWGGWLAGLCLGRFFPQLSISCLFLVVTPAGSCAFKPRSHSGKPTPALEGREAPERPLVLHSPSPTPPPPPPPPLLPSPPGRPAVSQPAVTSPPAALLERESDERATAMVPPAAQPWSPPEEPARAAASLPAARRLRASSPCPGPAAAAPQASARPAARRH